MTNPPPETHDQPCLQDKEIRRLGDCIIVLTEELVQARITIARLEVKSGVWGFIAGLIPALAAVIYFIIKYTTNK